MHLARQILQHKTSRCISIIIKPLRIFQFVRIGHFVSIWLHFNIWKILELEWTDNLFRRTIKFFLETVCGAAIVRIYDLHDRYGSYADEHSCLHPLECPIRRIRFRLSRRVDQPLCRGRLTHYSGNLRRTVFITVQ